MQEISPFEAQIQKNFLGTRSHPRLGGGKPLPILHPATILGACGASTRARGQASTEIFG